jgi:lysophospholipase L1-like esterase
MGQHRHFFISAFIFSAAVVVQAAFDWNLDRRIDRVDRSIDGLHQEQSRLGHGLNDVRRELGDVYREQRLLSPADLGNRRLDVRSFVIRNQLSQSEHPIVFIGDSITESARLPSSICGHSVVNAGIGGAAVSSYAEIARDVVGAIDASLVVIALGTNDAGGKFSEDFNNRYRLLVYTIRQHTPKLVLVGVPPIEDGPLKDYFDAESASHIDEAIREIARLGGDEFVNLRAAITSHRATIDGIHLWSDSYNPWLRAIREAIGRSIPCEAAAD